MMHELLIVIKFVVIFSFLFALLKFKVNLAISILLTSILTGVLYNLTPLQIFLNVIRGASEYNTLWMVGVIFSAMLLASLMDISGLLRKMTDGLITIVKDSRLAITLIPALIGLIPMPAGALVSAFMVSDLSNKLKLNEHEIAYLNFWFRHIWEPIWPMYQSVILASVICAIPVFQVSMTDLPISVFMVLIGGLIVYLGIRPSKHEELVYSGKISHFLEGVSPIILIILLNFLLKIDLLISFVASILYTLLLSKVEISKAKEALLKALDLSIIGAVMAIMIFKVMVEESGSMSSLDHLIKTFNLNPLIPLTFIPFIIGLLTGITFASVGVAFPLILPIIFHDGGMDANLFRLAFGAGFAGVLLTPLHLCLSTTIEYFKAEPVRVYRYLLPSVTLLIAILLFLELIF